MKFIIGLFFALFFCLFMGVTAISLGCGAIYPPINLVAQPLVCPTGEMSYQRNVSNPLPGRTYVQTSWVCVEPSGNATPISSFAIALIAGTFHGIVLFVFVAALALLLRVARGTGQSRS